MRGKALFLVLALLLAAGSAFAEGGSEAADQPIELQVYSGWTGSDAGAKGVFQQMADQFMKANPGVKITITTLQFTPLFTKFLTDVQAGMVPDVLHMHPQETAFFASQKLIDPEMVKRLGLRQEDFDEIAWAGSFYKGVQVVSPSDTGGFGLFYNKNLFRENGITKVPATGDELIATALKLTVDANGRTADQAGFDPNAIQRYGLTFAHTHMLFYHWYGLMAQQGEKLLNDDLTKCVFNDEKAIKAWQWMRDLVFKYHVTPKGHTAVADDFKAGKVAMALDGDWMVPLYVNDPPKFDVGTGPYPQVFEKRMAWTSGSVYSFPVKKAGEQQKDLTAKFVKFITTSDLNAKMGSIPAYTPVRTLYEKEPLREGFKAMIGSYVLLPNIVKSTQIYSAKAPSPIMTAGQTALMSNQVDLAVVVAQLRREIDGMLAP